MRLIRIVLAVAASVSVSGCSVAGPPPADKVSHGESLLALVDVAAQRVQLADTVAAAKWGTDTPINDPAREQAVLDAVATKSTQLGIDPMVSLAVFPHHRSVARRAEGDSATPGQRDQFAQAIDIPAGR